MKKFLSILMVFMMFTTFLVGCSSKKDDTTTENTSNTNVTKAADQDANTSDKEATVASDASGNVTIWYYWETEGHQKALSQLVKDFNDSQSDIVVEAKYVPFADFKKQLSIGASADELPDIVIQDNPDTAAYASMGIFADLSGKFDVSTYYPGPVNSCTLDGKLYGVPFGSNDLLLYYNKDMLDAAGCTVPATWDELLDTAKKCTKDNVYGFAHSSVQNEEGTFNFLTWVWSTGATAYEMNTEGGVKALNVVKNLIDSGSMPKEAINWTQGDTMNQFISGNLAMMINGTWQVPTMREQVPDLNWGVAPIPMDKQQASGLGGENYSVIAGGNEAAAIKFLEYATQKEQCLFMMNAMGYISSDSTIAKDQFAGDEVYEAFVEEMQYANARGPLAEWPEISNAISLAFNEVMTGAKAPEDAATAAQTTIDGIMNK